MIDYHFDVHKAEFKDKLNPSAGQYDNKSIQEFRFSFCTTWNSYECFLR